MNSFADNWHSRPFFEEEFTDLADKKSGFGGKVWPLPGTSFMEGSCIKGNCVDDYCLPVLVNLTPSSIVSSIHTYTRYPHTDNDRDHRLPYSSAAHFHWQERLYQRLSTGKGMGHQGFSCRCKYAYGISLPSCLIIVMIVFRVDPRTKSGPLLQVLIFPTHKQTKPSSTLVSATLPSSAFTIRRR